VPPLNLYARVRFLSHNFAHETAGAARIRHSLFPPFGGTTQNSGEIVPRECGRISAV
jgi:hypothetical protein